MNKKLEKLLLFSIITFSFSTIKVNANTLFNSNNKLNNIRKVASCSNSQSENLKIINKIYQNTTFSASSIQIKMPSEYSDYYAKYKGNEYKPVGGIITINNTETGTEVDIFNKSNCKIGFIKYTGNCLEDYEEKLNSIDASAYFNDANGNYSVSIKNNISKYKIELVYTTDGETEKSLKTIVGDGSVSVPFDANYKEVVAKIYDNASSSYCNGKLIGTYSIGIPKMKKNKLKNSTACNSIDNNAYPGVKSTIPECTYNYYNEVQENVTFVTSESDLQKKINNEKNSYDAQISFEKTKSNAVTKPSTITSGTVTNTCQFDNTENTKKVSYWTEKTGTYIDVFCREDLTYTFSSPKYTTQGGGFDYQVSLKPSIACKIVEKKKPQKRVTDICNYTSSCWGGALNLQGASGAGPNEEFDQCINKCDGGNYSQKCINSCYDKVYNNNSITNTSLFKDKGNLINLNSETKNTVQCNGYDITHYKSNCSGNSYKFNGHVGCGQYHCVTDNSNTNVYRYFVGNDCNAKCYAIISNSNNQAKGTKKISVNSNTINTTEAYKSLGCTNPQSAKSNQKEYETEMEKYQKEVAQATKMVKQVDESTSADDLKNLYQNTDFTYKITNKGKITTFNSKSTNTGKLDIKYQNGSVIINIPEAYLNDGQVLYNGNTQLTESYKKEALYGGNKFYIDILTGKVNNTKYWPYQNIQDSLKEAYGETKYNQEIKSKIYSDTNVLDKNIKIVIDNASVINADINNKLNININCLYGADTNDEPGDDDKKSNPLSYIYRTVDLSDMFPNDREPGWNWTDGAKTTINDDKNKIKKYSVDPTKLIDSLESMGKDDRGINNIYNSKYLEYSSTLKPTDIASIKRYNNNSNSNPYGKYDCTDNNYKFACMSNFVNDKIERQNTSSIGLNRYNGGSNNE